MVSMNLFVLLLFCCCFSLILREGMADIKLGVILDTNLRAGREEKIAIELAAELFNSSGSKLFINFRNSTDRNSLQSYSDADNLIKTWSADAVITAGTWPEVAPVAEAGRQAKILVLSLASTPRPPSSALRPTSLQLSFPISTTVSYLVDLIASYNWRSVILLYEDDDYATISGTLVANLTLSLQKRRMALADIVSFPPLDSISNPEALLRQELSRVKNNLCKVFVVVRSSPSLTVRLFKQAHTLGMLAAGYAWVLADDGFANHIDSAPYYSTSVSPYMRGVIGTKLYVNKTTASYRRFRAEFQRRFRSEYSKAGEEHYEPGVHALRAYDAMRAIALAVNGTSNMTLLPRVSSSNFEGLSGHINFGSDGNLVARQGRMAFQVINYVGRSYEEMGFWSEGSGFYDQNDKGPPGVKVGVLRPMTWPGRARNDPGGWGRLKVGVPNRTVFNQFVKVEGYDHENNVWNVTGYCIDVFRETVNSLKFSLDYEFIPFSGTYDELVDQVALKTFDLVVGDVTILADRSDRVDFTEPYVASGLSQLVPERPKGKGWLFLRPFSREVLATIIGTYIYTAIILWYLETKNNPSPGPWTSQLGNTLWLMCSTIFFPLNKIHSTYTKIIVVVWLFVVLIITQTFTASLSAILSTKMLEPVVDDTRIGCNGDSFVVKYLAEVLQFPKQRIYKIGNEDHYPQAFENGTITSAYLETPYLRVFLSQHKGYTVYGETHRLGGFGFVFPKGSELVSDFNKAILQLTENGALSRLENEWFAFHISDCPGIAEHKNDEYGLSLGNLWGLFVITASTTTIVFLLFIIQSFRRRVVDGFRLLREWLRSKLRKSMCSLREKIFKICPCLTSDNSVHPATAGK